MAACSRDEQGRASVEVPKDVDVSVQTDSVNLPTVPDVDVNTSTQTNSATVPTIGMQKDTVVVSKPVIGTKKTQVKTPDVDVNVQKRP